MNLRRPLPTFATMALFFLQSLSFGGWYSRVGELQHDIGLSAATLGLVFTGLAAGALLTYPFGPLVVERFGTRLVVLISIPAVALCCALSTYAWDGASLFIVLLVNGIGHGFATIAINVEADRLEGLIGRRTMNTCHGLWSLGFFAATLTGTAMRALNVTPAQHLWLVLAAVAVATLVVALPMMEAPKRPHAGSLRRKLFAVPTRPILLLVCTTLSCIVLEGSVLGWSVIYLRDSFAVPGWVETLTLPAFLLTVALGRLFMDRLVERSGPARVAAVLAAISFVGLLPVLWAGSLPLALLGFALIGLGVSAAFPLSVSAAARLGDRPASENVAALSVVQRTIGLAAAPLVGVAAGEWTIALAFAAMLPLPLLAIGLARYLEPRPVAIEKPAAAQ